MKHIICIEENPNDDKCDESTASENKIKLGNIGINDIIEVNVRYENRVKIGSRICTLYVN